MTTREEVGRRIRQAREEMSLSQGDLGHMLKRPRSHTAVSDMERGEVKLDIEELANLAVVLERDIAFFVLPQGEPNVVYRRGDYGQSPLEKRETLESIARFQELARIRFGPKSED